MGRRTGCSAARLHPGVRQWVPGLDSRLAIASKTAADTGEKGLLTYASSQRSTVPPIGQLWEKSDVRTNWSAKIGCESNPLTHLDDIGGFSVNRESQLPAEAGLVWRSIQWICVDNVGNDSFMARPLSPTGCISRGNRKSSNWPSCKYYRNLLHSRGAAKATLETAAVERGIT